MTGSNLTDVPKDIPLNSTTVDLANNSIQVLTSTSFTSLTEVKVMILNHNKISSIEPGAFLNQGGLKLLDLGNNAFQKLSGNTWKGLNSLEVLRITENKITTMNSTTFSNLPQLIVVQVDITQITTHQQFLLAASSYPDTPKAPNITVENVHTLLCDSSTCFLKEAGDKVNYMFNGRYSRPRCTNNRKKFWDEVNLNCPWDFTNGKFIKFLSIRC